MNKLIREFKDQIIPIMKANFERDGYLAPMLFYILEGKQVVFPIPGEYFENENGKNALSGFLNELARHKGMELVAVAMEAYAAKMDPHSPLTDLVKSGNMRVSELSTREDIILLAISTPMRDELVTLKVDPVAKKVMGKWTDPTGQTTGRFSNFFAFRRN